MAVNLECRSSFHCLLQHRSPSVYDLEMKISVLYRQAPNVHLVVLELEKQDSEALWLVHSVRLGDVGCVV